MKQALSSITLQEIIPAILPSSEPHVSASGFEAVGKKRTRLNFTVSLVTMGMMEVALLPLSVSDSELIGSWDQEGIELKERI